MKTLRSISKTESYPGGGHIAYGVLPTPAGPVTVAVDGGRVVAVRLGVGRRTAGAPPPLLRRALGQLREYFAGRRRIFDLPLRLDASPFTRRVLERVAEIPFGRAASYGEVAAAVRRPRAARAVGGAVGRNPLPILIPCHRVLAADRQLGGFGAGLRWKRFLLRHEAIRWR
ncbi:MAG: methylated-DNA--[protein]-cysteine S-methyltransferase [Planctomycetota bacterium]